MSKLPGYIGPIAFGLKMGVILPGMSIVDKVFEKLSECRRDGFLDDGDIVCITESVVARAQNNYVTIDEIAAEIRQKLNLAPDAKVGVVFPIASRNRFAMILKGIALAVPQGEVIVQFSFPRDEVGNQVISPDYSCGEEFLVPSSLDGPEFIHPITGVNYVKLYHDIIREAGARATIFLGNNPARIADYRPDGVIAADIHGRHETQKAILEQGCPCIRLDEICTSGRVYSEWGLLGSNMSSGDRVKLAPREGQAVVEQLQERLHRELQVKAEVLIYGDGAYRDPSSGIYELADPQPVFASTSGLKRFREGVKYKYLADYYYHCGKSKEEIERILESSLRLDNFSADSIEKEGTTPRRMEDVLASLADLVSGSADAGTPVVVIKGF